MTTRICSSALLFTAALLGQSTTRVVAWPAALPAPNFGKTIGGAFSGGGRMSALVTSGDGLYLAFAPAWFSAVSPVPVGGTVRDIVRMRPLAGSTRDRFLVTTGTGATIGRLEPNGTYTFTATLSAAWANAKNLRERRSPGSNTFALVAMANDGSTILTASGTIGGDPTTLAAIPTGGPLDSVEAIDWDHDGVMEVVGYGGGVAMPFELGGAPLTVKVVGVTEAFTAVVDNAADQDRLAVLGKSGASHLLHVVDHASAEAPVVVQGNLLHAGPLRPNGLAHHDLDNDDDTDLLLTHADNYKALLLRNGTSQGYVPFGVGHAQIVVEPNVTSPPGMEDWCPGTWEDFDYDGQPDLWQPMNALDQLAMTFLANGANQPKLLVSNWLADSDWIQTPTSKVNVNINATAPAGFTTLKVTVWRQPSPFASSPLPPLDPGYTYAAEFNLASIARPNGYYVPIPCAPAFWSVQDHFYLDMQWGGNPNAIGERFFAGYTMKNDLAQPESVLMQYLDETPQTTNDRKKIKSTRSDHVGGIITRVEMPPGSTAPPQTPD